MNAIEFNNVSKKFKRGERFDSLRDLIPNMMKTFITGSGKNGELHDKEFWALKDVSLTVNKGEVLGIIGANGAGKSTVLKLLSGILKPTSGEVRLNGRLSALIEVGAGFHEDLTGRENIYLNGAIMGMKKGEIDNKFDDIVEFSELEEFIDTPVKRYSSGMYARLGFSVSAHMDPDILLVDEVLSVGDMPFQAKCSEKMRALLDVGTTIVLVSHNINLIKSICRRVILLNKGTVLKDGDPDEVINSYQNICIAQQEKDFKKKNSKDIWKLDANKEAIAKILNVTTCDENNNQRNTFKIGEQIIIKIHYQAFKRIENPFFYVDVVRGDNVLCCSANSKDNNFMIQSIYGKGEIQVNLGKIYLSPGIYNLKIYIWDSNLISPYDIRTGDFVKIDAKSLNSHMSAVLLPMANWKIVDGESALR